MAKHEHPQPPARVFRPQSPPGMKSTLRLPPVVKRPQVRDFSGEMVTRSEGDEPVEVNQSAAAPEDLGDVIRAIQDMANELFTQFFAVPSVADQSGRVDPERFDTATRTAFVQCGNALDYAIRLVTEKGRGLRIINLRRELAEEMRAAGMTGDPADGESPTG